jgi:serine/threonine-protein kinase
MELLEGADLCQIADARGALPRWLVVDYMLQALEGLAHAHARGIVHRDLKPSNLFLANRADGTQIIKILDFGISKSTDPVFDSSGERKRAMQLTGGRAVLGSPPYMSPEQVRSPKTVNHQTDIWSLGIVMYELLTNSMPFGGDEINETFAQILEKEPQPIRSIVTGVPEGLEKIVMRCLAKNRENRFADVSELARALVAFGSGTWMQSADRIHATLTRGLEEAISGLRLKGVNPAPSSMDRMPIPVAPGRRLDSMQPEISGTASTVARRFTVLGSKHKNYLLASAGFIGVAAVTLIAATFYRQSQAASAAAAGAADPTTAVSADPSVAAAETPTGVAVANVPGITTAAPHMANPADEAPAAGPTGTVIGASPSSAPPAPAPSATTAAASAAATANVKKPVPTVARPVTPAPNTSPRKPPASPPAKTSLPPDLPRNRQ